MGMRAAQGNENAFHPATTLHGSGAFPFVIPSAAEGSAVLRTIPGNVFLQERSSDFQVAPPGLLQSLVLTQTP